MTTLLYGPKPKERPSGRRIAIAGVLLASACLLWFAGIQWVAPWADEAIKRGEDVLWMAYVYRLCYRPLAAGLLSAGILGLAGLVWDISLDKKPRQICFATGILLGIGPLLLLALAVLLYSDTQVPRAVFMVTYYYMTGANMALAALAGAAFYLACNPPGRGKEEPL